MSDTKSELKSIVLSTAQELEAAVAGNLYDDNGECRIIHDMDGWKAERYEEKKEVFCQNNSEDKLDTEAYDTYDEWMEDEIGTVDDVDEPEEMSLYDYIDKQSLGDIRFEVDSRLDLEGGKILFAYGGPTVWVHDDRVCGYWGFDSEEISLDGDTSSALLGFMEEQFQMALDSRSARGK